MNHLNAMDSRSLGSMELAHVRSLQEIARQRGFSRAARLLHLSQPAVSHHIRLLEAELGVRLLERVGKRAFPTEAGALLLAHAGPALEQLELGRQAVQQLRGRVAGRVRLGTGATLATYVLPAILGALARRHPELELAVVTGNSPDIVAAVADSALDVGVVTLPARGRHLEVAPFAVDALVAVAPPTREWRRRRSLVATDLARHPLICYERGGTIRTVIDGWFRRGGAAPRVAMELGNAEAIKRLVEAGLGIGVTSAITVRSEARAGGLAAVPLDPPLARELGIVRRRDRVPGPAVAALFAALEAARPRAAHVLGAGGSRARGSRRP
jgi:DNA-binding transcriptional LysR family regulator